MIVWSKLRPLTRTVHDRTLLSLFNPAHNNVRKPSAYYPIMISKPPIRTFVDFPFITKFLLVSTVAVFFFLVQTFRRTIGLQKVYIRRAFMTAPSFNFPTLWYERQQERLELTNYFNSPPTGRPIVLTGPDGTGKTFTLKNVMNGRPMTLFIDFRKRPIADNEEFMYMIVSSTGYLLPSTDLITRWLLREKYTKNKLGSAEVDRALAALGEMLLKEKQTGYPSGYPLICLSGIEALAHNILNKEKESNSTNLFKFLDFCVYAADNQLAHLFFITSLHFAKNELDKHDGWRHRREFVDFPYVQDKNIVKFLRDDVNSYMKAAGATQFSTYDIEHIVRCVGGSISDINAVIANILTGYSAYDILDRLIADSVDHVSEYLEKLLQPANDCKDSDEEELHLLKYQRFWSLIEALAKSQHPLPRIDLVNQIFRNRSEELDEHEDSQLISYFHKKYSIRNRFKEKKLSPQNVITESNENETVAVQGDVHGVSILTRESEFVPKIGLELLQERLEDVLVLPGSPKLKMAFRLVMSDSRLLEQNNFVDKKLKKRKLKAQISDYVENLEKLQHARKTLVDELHIWLSNYQQCISLNGKDETENLVKDIWNRRKALDDQIRDMKSQLDLLTAQIAELK